MTDGLKDAHRTAIIGALRANRRVERAVLFGSRAKETFTPGFGCGHRVVRRISNDRRSCSSGRGDG